MFSRSEFAGISDIFHRAGLHQDRAAQAMIAGTLTLMIISRAALIFVPFLFGRAVDAVEAKAVVVAVAMIGAFYAARMTNRLLSNLEELLSDRLIQRTSARLRTESFAHVLTLPYSYFVDKSSGAVTKSWDRGVKSVTVFINALLYRFIPLAVSTMIALVMLWSVFGLLTMALVASGMTGYFLYVQWRVQELRRHVAETNRHDDSLHYVAVDSLSNIQSVKNFNGYRPVEARLAISVAGYRTANDNVSISSFWVGFGGSLIATTTIAAAVLLNAYSALAGTITTGELVALYALLVQIFIPVSGLGRAYRDARRALTEYEQLEKLLEQTPEPQDGSAADLSATPVHVRNLSFSYPNGRAALHDISFDIQPGRTTALVGPSGSGKSTLAKLLLQLYPLEAPAIFAGGQPAEASDLKSWRGNFGVVSQDTALLNDTVAANIRFGADVRDAQIREAAAQAELATFIDGLPDGFETVIGERGVKLSGGEAQRLAIARALVRNPNILLFDEATSSLDTVSERDIQANIARVARGRTSIVIAHRLSTVVDADEILVMNDGRITERGTHDELLARRGLYAVLWQNQAET